MRWLVYASFLSLCCALIQSSLADNKNNKKSKDDEDYRGDKKYKTKYRTYYGDDNLEDYQVKKNNGKNLEKKAPKHVGSEEVSLEFRKNKKNKREREKIFIPEDDVIEFLSETKQKFSKDAKGDTKQIRRKKNDSSAEKSSKNKKFKDRVVEQEDDDDDDDSEEEEVPNMKKSAKKSKKNEDSDEEIEEETPKKFRKKIRVRIPDSPEDDDSDEREDGHGRTCKTKGGRKSCWSDDGSEEVGEKPGKSKKIKYSIKFAHEKEKTVHSEDDNIMKKIHRSDKKKYKYEQEDDDDSSEEHTHPKRLRFLDDDED